MAGRVQLETSGPRDRYFIENPEFSYFKEAFRKHGNYARETINMQPLSPPEWNSFARFRIRYDQGDLLTNVAFRIKLSGLPNRIPEGGTQYETGWCDEVANAMIEYVELQIGEIPISRLHSDYLTIHSEHNVTQTKQFALKKLTGKFPNRIASLQSQHKSIGYHLGRAGSSTEYYVDVPFWFYRHDKLAIPICSLKEQEIDIVVKLRDHHELTTSYAGNWTIRPPRIVGDRAPVVEEFTMDAEIAFVDAAERVRLQNSVIDYVITQVQRESFTVEKGKDDARVQTTFVNPVKELYFVVQRESRDETGLNVCYPFDYDNITDDASTGYGQTTSGGKLVLWEHLNHLSITLDGAPVLTPKTGKAWFLKATQGGIHHSKCQLVRRFYSYSFATDPQSPDPSGQINFTPIKSQVYDFKLHSNPHYRRDIRIYALSYNVLRVDGRAGYARTLFNDN